MKFSVCSKCNTAHKKYTQCRHCRGKDLPKDCKTYKAETGEVIKIHELPCTGCGVLCTRRTQVARPRCYECKQIDAKRNTKAYRELWKKEKKEGKTDLPYKKWHRARALKRWYGVS